MFKKSRNKIVAAIMSILCFLFVGTLAVIYTSSYFEVRNTNYAMLERHAQMYILTDHMQFGPEGKFPPGWLEPLPGKEPGGKRFENTPSFQLATFYSVAIADDGQVLATDIGGREVYTKETLEAYASNILASNEKRGTKENLVFHVEPKHGYTLVAFMDNTVIRQSMTTLFRYTIVFGLITLVALFFLAVYLAKRIVKPLEESYRKQTQFISDAGHELKTPVSVVSANAELLSREIGNNQWLSNIQYENERMGQLVCQLLELAKTENVTPHIEILDLSRLVAGSVLPFESVAFENGLSVNTKIDSGISIKGNCNQLSQLVAILVDNAIRHGRTGKTVEVVLAESRNSAVLSVINDGEPISNDQKEHIFERFYRADEARSGGDKHYGLGLAIAKAIVTAHSGKIDVTCYDGKICFSVQFSKVK